MCSTADVIFSRACDVYAWDIEGWVGSSEGCFRGHRRARKEKQQISHEAMDSIESVKRKLTLKRNARERVLFSSRSIGLGIFIILNQLLSL
ncbi:MAG: hypothetical protein LBE67_10850 [Kocuria palustris]|nr:hypothetical protein [Kocuria palustris]